MKRVIQLLAKIEKEDPKKFEKVQEVYGNIIKLGAVEDTKNRDKLTKLCRFTTNQRNNTSFDMYIENKKKGQEQVMFKLLWPFLPRSQFSLRFSTWQRWARAPRSSQQVSSQRSSSPGAMKSSSSPSLSTRSSLALYENMERCHSRTPLRPA